MTKTKAAEIIARSVRKYARDNGRTQVTKDLCEARMSELTHPHYADTLQHDAAFIANVKTVYRLATQYPLDQ